MKIYSDKQFNTKESTINVGDFVIFCQKPKKKLFTKFDTDPYQVISKKGLCVLIKMDGIILMRNSTF